MDVETSCTSVKEIALFSLFLSVPFNHMCYVTRLLQMMHEKE